MRSNRFTRISTVRPNNQDYDCQIKVDGTKGGCSPKGGTPPRDGDDEDDDDGDDVCEPCGGEIKMDEMVNKCGCSGLREFGECFGLEKRVQFKENRENYESRNFRCDSCWNLAKYPENAAKCRTS